MRDTCRQFRDRIVEASVGEPDAGLSRHLESCAGCSQLYARYRAMASAASQPWASAPQDLIAMAKALLPSTRRVVLARRIGSSLLAGARGPLGEFQMIVGTDDVSVRLMATQETSGWQIMGRFPEGDWRLDSEHAASVDGDGFTIDVPSLEDSRFSLVGERQTIEVPSLTELLAGEE